MSVGGIQSDFGCPQGRTASRISFFTWWDSENRVLIFPILTSDLLSRHREQGDSLIIISATNLFITEPIAELLDIPHILSTEPEMIDNQYTGQYLGTPTYKEGEIVAINAWLHKKEHDLTDSYFYSDSINDLPLLEEVSMPVAVNSDDELQQIAKARGWKILDLRS